MKTIMKLLAGAACCLLVSCGAERPQHFDHAADDLPFAQPKVVASVDTFTGVPVLPDDMRHDILLRRAFFQGDFTRVDQFVSEAHNRYVQGLAAENEADLFIDSLKPTQLAGIGTCRSWLSALPDSYAANWVCGAMWKEGAWVARGGQYVDKTAPVRLALMRERIAHSNELLSKAVSLNDKPVEALVLLAANRFVLGEKETADTLLDRAKTMMPVYAPIYGTKMNFSLPEWGGSAEKVVQIMADAEKAKVDEISLLYFHDEFIVQPNRMSSPGAARTYWETAIVKKPTFDRLRALAEYFRGAENWRDGLPAASRLVEAYPGAADGYWMRGLANEKLGNIPEALADYRMAAAQGNNSALQSLIQAYVQGGLGLPKKQWNQLIEVCFYGAELGSAAAANCTASLFREGAAFGTGIRNDIPQSFAWHVQAARAGYHNSQYDLGWLLLTNRAPGVTEEQAKINGLFWLRRAAELDHQFAKKKLQENGYAEQEEIAENGLANTVVRETIQKVRTLMALFP